MIEGRTNKEFWGGLLQIFKYIIISNRICRWERQSFKIKGVNPLNKYNKTTLIFDTYDDRKQTKENIVNQLEQSFPNESLKCEIFLLPNNYDSSNLEDLLKNIATKPYVLKMYRKFPQK